MNGLQIFRTQSPGPLQVISYDVAIYTGEDCKRWKWNGMPVVATPDFVDISNVALLRCSLAWAAAESASVIVDMTATTFCDVTCVNSLLDAAHRLRDGGGELVLVICAASVQRVLDTLNLCQHFRIVRDLHEAASQNQQACGYAA